MKYKTHNLDETAFCVLHGFKPKIKAIDGTSATFTFEDTAALRKLVKLFYTTNPKVPIHQWLSTRQLIKKETQYNLKLQIMGDRNGVKRHSSVPITPIAATLNTFHPKVGENYYYVDSSKAIINNLFAATRVHQNRSASNRCFRTKEEADNFVISQI